VTLIMDTLAAIALGLEPPTPGLMVRKPKRREEPIITRTMWWNIFSLGGYFLVATLALLQFNFLGGTTELERLTIVFATFVFFQVFNLFNARSLDPTRSGLAGLRTSPAFLGIMGGIAVLTVVIVEIGGEVFRTTPLDPLTWIKIIAFTATALVWGEASRLVRLKLRPHSEPPSAAVASA
jgi:P-type Ca2+ transporter type 2C